MNLDIAWSEPTPTPSCGYKALYRRKADPNYTEVDTSGTTLAVQVSAPACYEGNLITDCCSKNISTGVPFGINSYQPLHIGVVVSGTNIIATGSSAYPNPYDLLVSVTIQSHDGGISGSTNASGTYPAGSTSYQIIQRGVPQGTIIDSFTVTSIVPIFNNGGQLQQLDPINTPSYFGVYWDGNISGSTWNGSPASLPSFTIDEFNITELDTDGVTILAGNLIVSYILGSVYSNSFSSFTYDIYDSNNAFLGSAITQKTPLGLRSDTIPMTKVAVPLTDTSQFTIKLFWPDGSLLDSKVFYLPSS